MSICAKASQTLGYLHRNLSHSPASTRKLAYVTFVHPQLEFASSIWSPHQDYVILMLEAVQNRAARFILSNYDWHSSLTRNKVVYSRQTLCTRRKIALLCLIHKYIHGTTEHKLPLVTQLRTFRRLQNHLSLTRIFGRTEAFNSSALPKP